MDNSIPVYSDISNARPYSIFFGYLGVCLAVAVFIISKLFEKAGSLYTYAPSQLPPRRYIIIFATLAACSLLSTWGFMFQYFQWSYNNWLTVHSQHDIDPTAKYWGLWLRETSLFKEAWESVIVGHNRYWWSHQIFYFAMCLGLHLEWRGVRRDIKYTWAFMLLGQIVAISFATNLFFLTLLLSPQQNPTSPASKGPRSTITPTGQRRFGPWLIDAFAVAVTFVAAVCLSGEKYWNGAPGFMPLLLLPHVVLLLLPTARAILPTKLLPLGDAKTVDKFYITLWILVTSSVGQLAWKTQEAYITGNLSGIRNALLEHPAVSSVGFDVVFCWISWLVWWQIQDDQWSYLWSNA